MLHAAKRKKSTSSTSSSSKSLDSLCSAEKDSLFNCCTPIERGELCKVKKNHHKRRAINTQSPIQISTYIPNIKEFLETRKSIFGIELPERIDEEYIDCIKITDNGFFINKERITKAANIKINKYLTNGCYGSIFIASHNRSNNFIIKFMDSHANNIKEINAMINIKQSLKLSNFPIPNFLYMAYYYFRCNKFTIKSNIKKSLISRSRTKATDRNIIDDIETNINTNYSLIVLEYFDDTIYKLLANISLSSTITPFDKYELYKSIFAQMILSLYILHNKFDYIHNDTHLNNFLYKTVNKEDNYFHYYINGNNYYIKNCGYLVVLADYGLCRKTSEYVVPNKNKKIFKDYSCIVSQILINIPNIEIYYADFFEYYIKKIKFYFPDEEYTLLNEHEFLYNILINCLNIASTIDDDRKKINNEPYMI